MLKESLISDTLERLIEIKGRSDRAAARLARFRAKPLALWTTEESINELIKDVMTPGRWSLEKPRRPSVWPPGEVRPSLVGIARLACACKQTVVNCLKLLSLYGFVIVHRRIKRIRTALGFKVVQDTNAYTIQEPQALALRRNRRRAACPIWAAQAARWVRVARWGSTPERIPALAHDPWPRRVQLPRARPEKRAGGSACRGRHVDASFVARRAHRSRLVDGDRGRAGRQALPPPLRSAPRCKPRLESRRRRLAAHPAPKRRRVIHRQSS